MAPDLFRSIEGRPGRREETIRGAMAGWFTCPGMFGLWEEAKFAYPPYLVADIDRAIEAFGAVGRELGVIH